MADLSTPEQNARKVLDIFKHLDARPPRFLRANNIVAVGKRQRWMMTDLQQGLEFAMQKGWINNRDGAFKLTTSGRERL